MNVNVTVPELLVKQLQRRVGRTLNEQDLLVLFRWIVAEQAQGNIIVSHDAKGQKKLSPLLTIASLQSAPPIKVTATINGIKVPCYPSS